MIRMVLPSETFGKDWVDFLKAKKEMFVQVTERGDIPPVVIAERDGHIQTLVFSPQVNKHMGLYAARVLKAGFDPDHIIMVMDAHIHLGKVKEGQTKEEAYEEYQKKFPKGMQAACDEEGACDTGEITDCLICHRIDKDGKFEMFYLPYSYHGKGGPPFRWLDKEEKYKDCFKALEGEDGTEYEGFIPDSLREIMSEAPLTEIPILKDKSKEMEFSPERQRFHTARACLEILANRDYIIFDAISPTHPEWTDAIPRCKSMLTYLFEQAKLPMDSLPAFFAVVDQHLGKPTFIKEIVGAFKALPAAPPELIQEAPDLAIFIEGTSLAPKNFPTKEKEPKRPKPPFRVKVWNGDQSQFLGEGEYVGDVPVYFIRMPDDTLRSLHNAEEPPPKEFLEETGGKLVKMPRNPKIKLDSGDTVYGCQVWWEPVAGWDNIQYEQEEEHECHEGCAH